MRKMTTALASLCFVAAMSLGAEEALKPGIDCKCKEKCVLAQKNGGCAMSVISTRKSVRKFDPSKTVDDATIEKLLKAAMCAPSALDKRPWEFIVVRDQAKLDALAEASPYCRVNCGAKLAFIVCGRGASANAFPWWAMDCSAATQNILLAAHANGLGAVWTAVFPDETKVAAIRKILSLPDDVTPLNIVPVGYPAEDPPVKDKWDKTKVHYDKW